MLLCAAMLAACARTAPPAPVVQHGRPGAAAAQLAPPPSPEPHPDRIKVQPGDTLYGIARRYDLPVRAIIEANALAPPYRLGAGSTLALPQLRVHTVRSGDTLSSISRLYGVEASTLAHTNRLAPPYTMRAGEALILPAPVEPPAPPAASGADIAHAIVPPPKPATPEGPAAFTAEASPAVSPLSAMPAPPVPPPRPPPGAEPAGTGLQTRARPVEGGPARAHEETAMAPPSPAGPASAHGFIWPVQGRILNGYGAGEGGVHNDGVNIAAPQGTPVVAADAGVVAYAGNELRGYGNLILIKHANGWMTAYAHNSVLLVKRGERVRRGQTIARVGATGTVGEPQLHFEIRRGTRALDPGEYLPSPPATAVNG